MLYKKICIIGGFAVGKTSLVRRYVLNEFSPDYQATLGVNIYKFTDHIPTREGGEITINEILWDIEGSTTREETLKTYLRGAAGALVVGDVTRDDVIEDMIENARFFSKELPGRPLVFALNKIDLVEDRDNVENGHALIEEFGGTVLHTSAAEGTEVPTLFRTLAARVTEIGA
ncbi:MAG: GTP-binding protein [Rhodospirillales bacterium]|nr:GTP-binding protein [Rhodospirillales bacterium]